MAMAICAAAFGILSPMIHLATALLAGLRARPLPPLPPPPDAPPVSVIRPVCGIDNHDEETLASTFALDYPRYEILFCVALARDPVIPLVERLLARHPHVSARLLVGDDRVSDNPKLNNVVKGWRAAEHDWIAITDSNVLMPCDYLQRLLATWRSDTGLVCSPPVGCAPDGFAAEFECAVLNTYQARWQCAANAVGFAFAQGKTLFLWRPMLERAGGIRALAAEPAEDAAATKLVRRQGLRVRLVDAPFRQPLGRRAFADVWRRQVRWARLRRATFPAYYALELLSTPVWPTIAVALAAEEFGLSPWSAVLAVAALWYGAEALLAHFAGWHLSGRLIAACLLRDLMLPLLWVEGWRASGFSWRGNQMTVAEGARNG
jgi:ceramide glucosyltransferase